jgi:hypothetical protein
MSRVLNIERVAAARNCSSWSEGGWGDGGMGDEFVDESRNRRAHVAHSLTEYAVSIRYIPSG